MTRLALLTGGSRGIGKATADLLRAHGWDVIDPTRRELDFSIQASVTAVEKYWLEQGIPVFDALIFCHGEWYSKSDEDRYLQDWCNQYHQRVMWPFEFMEFILGGEKPPAAVVIVSSTQAFSGRYQTGPYAAACAAQVRLTLGYAKSWTRSKTRFNVVCPGLTDTLMGVAVRVSGDCLPDAVPQSPESVAAVIAGLVEDGTSNGRVVRVVDGEARDAKWSW